MTPQARNDWLASQWLEADGLGRLMAFDTDTWSHLTLRAEHRGTVWRWLIGPFVEAWLRVGAGGAAEADARFLQPIRDHLGTAGLGHISEVADSGPPRTPRGCPFQAWSLGEHLGIAAIIQAELAESQSVPARRSA